MKRPKPPPSRLIQEGNSERCDKCGSSIKRKFIFFKRLGCIQPNCVNYYKGYPNNDINSRYKIYK